MAGATPEQLKQIKNEAEEAADNDPVDLKDFDGGESTTGAYWYGMFFDGNYLHYLTNPSEMDDGVRYTFYGLLGTGGGALSLAGGLAAWPVIAEFAVAEFALPVFGFGGGGLAFAGGGSTGGVLIGGGTITGSQILAGVGLLGSAVFMTRPGFEKMAGGNNEYHNSQVPRIMKEYGLQGKKIQRMIHDELHKLLPGERTVEAIREIIELFFF